VIAINYFFRFGPDRFDMDLCLIKVAVLEAT